MELTPFMNGIKAANVNIKIIGNNIINVDTNNFKSSKTLFKELNPNSISKNINIGMGVQSCPIIQSFIKGHTIYTDNPLDVAISKNGFFKIKDTNNGNLYYTRNGHFLLDNQYNLVNAKGMHILGYNNKYNFTINTTLKPNSINIKKNMFLPNKTTRNITISAILNTDNFFKNSDLFDPKNKDTYTNQSRVTIYDSMGNPKKLNLFFLKKSVYNWQIYFTDEKLNKIQTINFLLDDKEEVKKEHEKIIKIENIDLKDGNKLTIKVDMLFQHNISDCIIKSITQDGYSSGKIKNISINENGILLGKYSNKQTRKLGQVALYNISVKRNLQLEKENNSLFNNNVVVNKLGIPGDKNFGKLITNSLEGSNVDLNKELINIITAQINYHANIQSFKTQDKILNTLINLK